MERETETAPVDLQLEVGRYRQMARSKAYPVTLQIANTADVIWRRMRRAGGTRPRPRTKREKTQAQAQERIQEMKDWMEYEKARKALARGPHPPCRTTRYDAYNPN